MASGRLKLFLSAGADSPANKNVYKNMSWSWKGVYKDVSTKQIPGFMTEFAEKALPKHRLLFNDAYKPSDIDEAQKPEKYKQREYKDFFEDLVRELVDKWYSGVHNREGMKWSVVQQQRKNRFKTQKETEKAIEPILDFDKILDEIDSDAARLTRGLENWPSNPGLSPIISDLPYPSTDPKEPQLVYGLRDTLYKYELGDGYKVMPFMDKTLEHHNVSGIVWSPTLNIAMHSYFLEQSKNVFPLRFILPQDWQTRLVTDNIQENNMETGESYTEEKFVGMLFVYYHNDKPYSADWKKPPYGFQCGHIPLFIFGPYHTTSVEKYNEPYFSHFKFFNVNGMMVDLGQLFPRKRFTYAEIRDVMYKLSPQMDASEIAASDIAKKIKQLEGSPESQDIFGRKNADLLERLKNSNPPVIREHQRLEMFRVDGRGGDDVHLLIRKRQDGQPHYEGLSRVCFDWSETRGSMRIRDFNSESAMGDCTFYGSYNAGGGQSESESESRGFVFGVLMAILGVSAIVPRSFFAT